MDFWIGPTVVLPDFLRIQPIIVVCQTDRGSPTAQETGDVPLKGTSGVRRLLTLKNQTSKCAPRPRAPECPCKSPQAPNNPFSPISGPPNLNLLYTPYPKPQAPTSTTTFEIATHSPGPRGLQDMGAGACRAEGACPALQSPDFVLKVLGSVFWELEGQLLARDTTF